MVIVDDNETLHTHALSVRMVSLIYLFSMRVSSGNCVQYACKRIYLNMRTLSCGTALARKI